MNLWPLPFLWTFPSLTPYSCLPSLQLEYFLPEVCQTSITCLHGHAPAEAPSKGEEQQRLFCLFGCLVCWFCFFLKNFFFPHLLLPPHNKISSYAQKANVATQTTLRTLFSNLSFYMSFKSLNILNKFFHSVQVGASHNMHSGFWKLNIFIGFSGNAVMSAPQYSDLPHQHFL